MSLQLAAQHLASRGRGPDTTLVHMAPQEVAGLQALAKAHGGSLTINPDTGLAEAGVLSSILPMVAGAALSFVPGVGPMMAAGLVGGGTALATGSLQKGLMAGLGAYGGAGLAGSLAGAGAAGAAEAGMAGAGLNAAGAVAPEAVAANLGVQGAATGAGSQAAMLAEQASGFGLEGLSSLQNAAAIPGTSLVAPQNVVDSIVNQVPTTTAMPQLSAQGVVNQAAANATNKYLSGSALDQLGSGARAVMDNPSQFLTKENMKYGLAALTPVGMEMMAPKKSAVPEPTKYAAQNYNYAYNPSANPQAGYTGAATGERTYFNPVYTRMAEGGPVQAMSERNDAQTFVMNGGQMFAEGGETKAVQPVEDNPYYTLSGMSGDAFKYLMGQQAATPRAPAATVAAPVQQAQAQVAQNLGGPNPVFSKVLGNMNPLGQSMFRGMFADNPAIQQAISGNQGGYWQEDTSGRRDFTFDPNSGQFTAAPAPRRFVPYEAPATTTPGLSWDNMVGGMAQGGIASLAQGGQSHLGDYSDGGRLLRGPGDGVSDDIPATIGDKRPARLADGEFVVPARIVSELGNGSTEAGARKLYAMMDRVQKARGKTTGKDRVAVNTKAERMLPA